MRRGRRVIDEGSIWVLAAPLTLWAVHFLLSYWVAAVWCAKGWDAFADARLILAGLTAAALAAVAGLAVLARRRYRGTLEVDEAIEDDSAAARNRFLGHVALSLALLAGLAIVMTFLPALVFRSC